MMHQSPLKLSKKHGAAALAAALAALLCLPYEACAYGEQATYGPRQLSSIPQSSGSIGISSRSRSPDLSESDRSKGSEPNKRSRNRNRRQRVAENASQQGLHAQPWAFGMGRSLEASRGGIDGSTMLEKAHPTPKKPAKAEEPEIRPTGRHAPADAFNLHVDREGQAWSGHQDNDMGEDVLIGSNHRVRAYAGVKDDDVSFGLGPEVVVRDKDQTRQNMGKTDQPDIDAGVGMRFKVDF